MIEQIKEALSLESAWSEYASSEWVERGKTNCPLPDHTDATPSCMIYGDRWWCFGCNRGGDQIDLVAHVQFGGSVSAAIFELANRFDLEGSIIRPKELAPSPESLFSQASDQAYWEVLDKLKKEFSGVHWTGWDRITSTYLDSYDDLIEAVDNGLPVDRAMDYLLAWRLWGLGRILDNRNRKLVNELREGKVGQQAEEARNRGGNRTRASRARAWLTGATRAVNVD